MRCYIRSETEPQISVPHVVDCEWLTRSALIQVAQINTTTWAVANQFDGMYTLTSQTVTVPEPGSAGLLLIGLAALAGAGTLRKKLIA